VKLTGRRFALIEIDWMTDDDFEGHVLYAFEVRPSPTLRRLRHWAHVAWAGWST
jgi:hypothetical protein